VDPTRAAERGKRAAEAALSFAPLWTLTAPDCSYAKPALSWYGGGATWERLAKPGPLVYLAGGQPVKAPNPRSMPSGS
jgi:hypothetical protein